MDGLLVSMCLLGKKVRYDGGSKPIPQHLIQSIFKKYKIYPFCPEVSGGLTIPRIPAEIIKKGLVMDKFGSDVSKEYLNGATLALDMCLKNNIKLALLKENSPSCGVYKTYDGNFNGTIINGSGITTLLLRENDIKVFSENEINMLI